MNRRTGYTYEGWFRVGDREPVFVKVIGWCREQVSPHGRFSMTTSTGAVGDELYFQRFRSAPHLPGSSSEALE